MRNRSTSISGSKRHGARRLLAGVGALAIAGLTPMIVTTNQSVPGWADSCGVQVGVPTCNAEPATFYVGFDKENITPTSPFSYLGGEGWQHIGEQLTGDGGLYVRTITIQGADSSGKAAGQPIVISAIDSQGYFAGYQAGPDDLGVADYGLDQIRSAVSTASGIPAANIAFSSTHTHTAPDTLGIWGGMVDSNGNQTTAYFETVKTACITSVTNAVANAKAAHLWRGEADGSAYVYNPIPTKVDPNDYSDPTTWPLDGQLRVLQAVPITGGTPIVTLFDFGVHPDLLEGMSVISPDWPAQVISHIDTAYGGDAMFVPGTIGEEPVFPNGDTVQHTLLELQQQEGLYAKEIDGVVDSALKDLADVRVGGVGAASVPVEIPASNPFLLALDYVDSPQDHALTGAGHVERAITPPYLAGNTLGTTVSVMKIGDGLMLNTPGEMYSDIFFSARDQIQAGWYMLSSLTNDQLGYFVLPAEWPVANAYGVFSPAAEYADGPTAGADVVKGLVSASALLGFAVSPNAADLVADRDPVVAQMQYCYDSGACQQAAQDDVP